MTGLDDPNPARLYAEFLAPAVFEPWAEELLRRADVTPGERILDVGCGTGVVTRAAARIAGERGSVIGLDFNPAMLEVARQTASPDGAARILYVLGSADDIAYPDASFDLITCQQMLQFAPDRPAVLGQFRRVLAPGGRTAIAVWADISQNPDQKAINDAIVRHAGPPGIAAGLAFSSPDELESLLIEAGFTVRSLELVVKEARFPEPALVARRWLLAATAGIPSFRQLDGAARDSLIETIAGELTDFVREKRVADHIVITWRSYVAIAEAD